MLGRRIATTVTAVVTALATPAVLSPATQAAPAAATTATTATTAVTGTTAQVPRALARFTPTRVSCPPFTGSHVMSGRSPRRDPRCRPLGLDGGVVRSPLSARALQRDLRNYGHRGPHHDRHHRGTDLLAPCGAKVRAAHAGKVVVLTGRSGLGRRVGVSTGPRRLTTWYGNLGRITVGDGAMVRSGQPIARVGRSGVAPRCLLHFAVSRRAGAQEPLRADPSRWLRSVTGSHVGGLPPGRADERTFMAASFNVLGNSHTRRGGHWASGARRMALTLDLLRANHVQVAGLQELEPPQKRALERQAGRWWKVHSPQGDPRDSIAWRRARFSLVWASSVRIPYRKNVRPMPVVALRDKVTGKRTVFVSVHNVAGGGRIPTTRRRISVARELAAVARIRRNTGLPVVLLGDFNDRRKVFYCKLTDAGLVSSFGGLRGRRCAPPLASGVDWIFRTRGIRFAGSQRLRDGVVARASDHPLVLARLRR